MSTPKEKKERILVAAQEVFGKNGFSGATIKMIADKAQVAFGLVSHYYESKDKLFITAGTEMVNSLLDEIRSASEHCDTGLAAVEQFIRSYLGFTETHLDTFPILLHCSPFSNVNINIDKRVITDKFMELIHQMEIYIKEGKEDGSIRNVPASETAFCIYGAIVGAVRTKLIAGYEVPDLFNETLNFAIRSLEEEPRFPDMID